MWVSLFGNTVVLKGLLKKKKKSQIEKFLFRYESLSSTLRLSRPKGRKKKALFTFH